MTIKLKNQLDKEVAYHEEKNAFICDELEEALNGLFDEIGDDEAIQSLMNDPYIVLIQPEPSLAALAARAYTAAQAAKNVPHEITFDGVGYEVQILPF